MIKTALPHATQYALLSALTLPVFEPQPEGYLDTVLATAKTTIAQSPEQHFQLDRISHHLKREHTLVRAISECALFDEAIRFMLACEQGSPRSAGALVKSALNYLDSFGDILED